MNKGCDHRDYMACVDFTLHNRHQIVVTGIGMMSSPPRGAGRVTGVCDRKRGWTRVSGIGGALVLGYVH